MNKKNLFREKHQHNSCNRTKKTIDDVLQSNRSKRTKDNGETSTKVPNTNLYNNHLNNWKGRLKRKGHCEEYRNILPAHTVLDQIKRIEGIDVDDLLYRIKELKNHVKLFEKQYRTKSKSRTMHQYNEFVNAVDEKQVRDTDDFQNWRKNQSSLPYNDYILADNYKPSLYKRKSSYLKDAIDSQKRNYKTKQNANHAVFATVKDNSFQKTSKNQKCKSNVSISMSTHSHNRKKFIQIKPRSDLRKFQSTAEEFIDQAEELKSKIGYILDCCGCNVNNAAESKSIFSVISGDCIPNENFVNNEISEHDLKRLFVTVNTQYKEILALILSVQEEIIYLNNKKRANKSNLYTKLLSSCVPKVWRIPDKNVQSHRLRAGKTNTKVEKHYCQGVTSHSGSCSDNLGIEIKTYAHKTSNKNNKNPKHDTSVHHSSRITPPDSKKKKKVKKKMFSCFCF